MLVGRDPKSLGETARSISKARISVKSSALVLGLKKINKYQNIMIFDR